MNNSERTSPLLLDSSLIITTKNKIYDVKLVQCGDFVQLYLQDNKKLKKEKNDSYDLELKKIKIDKMFEDNSKKSKSNNLVENIEEKNIIRSKLQCQKC